MRLVRKLMGVPDMGEIVLAQMAEDQVCVSVCLFVCV